MDNLDAVQPYPPNLLIPVPPSVFYAPRRQNQSRSSAHLRADLHGFLERRGTSGEDHELLESQAVTGVLSAVDHVKRGHRHLQLFVAGEVGEVLRQRKGFGGVSCCTFWLMLVFVVVLECWGGVGGCSAFWLRATVGCWCVLSLVVVVVLVKVVVVVVVVLLGDVGCCCCRPKNIPLKVQAVCL